MKKVLLFGVLLCLLMWLFARSVRVSQGQGLGNCTTGWTTKDESTDSLVTDAANDGHWVKAVIKAGSQNQGDACFTFTQDGDNGCYAVFGLGTDTAHASKIGEGSSCKDISHVEWFLEEPISSPSASPSASPTIEPTATPSSLPSPLATTEPTSTPSAIPTPSASVTPSPTPEVSPIPGENQPVEKQMEQMIEEVKKTDPQILGTMGLK
jgi:hypothetical protein